MAKKFTPASTFTAEETALQKDYSDAQPIGRLRIGNEFLFILGLLHTRYIPLRQALWAYPRQGQALVSSGCRRVLTPTHILAVLLADGQRLSVDMDSREEVWDALRWMQCGNPQLEVGYSEELERQFAKK